ncbi:MAG: hypothetical protein DLM59_16110 [Pseudonocardiales bacterium]|nr:MAG: hypothetical protein DLM59_16110 [Pseudonocardiales bacterium]
MAYGRPVITCQTPRSTPAACTRTSTSSPAISGRSTPRSSRTSADRFPHVVEVIAEIMKSGRVEDFEFGLDLILDGLARGLAQA